MNIKTSNYLISPIDRGVKEAVSTRNVKSNESNPDRDPNGQRQREKDPNEKQFLNDEEMDKVLEKLRNLPGVKDNYLKVELVVKEVNRLVLITDPTGKVVRRIPENELWPLIQEKENNKGHLIDKAG
jgi:uncharacterized FlaG/YvyC family protein